MCKLNEFFKVSLRLQLKRQETTVSKKEIEIEKVEEEEDMEEAAEVMVLPKGKQK